MIRRNTIISFAAVTIFATAALIAGPLDPPAGPVTSTYKTIAEVEPRIAISAANTPGDADSLFQITQPGSYYLTGNITGVVGRHGIEIAASGVTLDLSGFDLLGVPDMGEFSGVRIATIGLSNIAVINGSVRNWGSHGLDLGTFFSAYNDYRVEGIRASGNAGTGIRTGDGCTVSNCSAYNNTEYGISTGRGAIIRNCYMNGALRGIVAGFNSNVSGCTVEFAGQYSFHLQGGATITDCVAVGTGGLVTNSAFFIGAGSTAVNCVARSNAGAGFITEDECSLLGCSATNNSGRGISTGDGCTISDCTAINNLGSGISVGSGCTVADSLARRNGLDGIICASACLIRGNTSSNNGFDGNGAGVHSTGPDNHIEGNNCTYNTRGIDVDSVRNSIVKNTCSLNGTNWDIQGGNVCLVIQATTAGAILGNAGGVPPGSTDPNANFTR